MDFKNETHERVFKRVISGVSRLGYGEGLLLQQYEIHDWFLPKNPVRSLPAAAFGRQPPSYDTACIAVLVPNEKDGRDLIADYRALGAPVALEVHEDRIVQWKVGRDRSRISKWDEFPPQSIAQKFRERRGDWSPQSILRAKNVFAQLAPRQLDFIDLGLIPALEHHVREKLDRLLREVLKAAARTFKKGKNGEPDMQQLFRLVFRFIAAKVLCDRRVSGFRSISDSSDAETILDRVGRYYKQSEPILADPSTRQVVADRIWNAVSFQNLSVEALAYVYENTLVDEALRRKMGTHSTPSSVARYIVSRLIDENTVFDALQIVEPCSGHGIFLVAALERLRDLLPSELDPDQRHRCFVRALRGFEMHPFALEVSKLCLMLADFPFPNGWRLSQADVFASRAFSTAVSQADVVLCNPPFGDFSAKERERYPRRRAVQKPAELLHRVLDKLKPSGALGFVVPHQFLDGRGYRAIRERLAQRFAHVEIVTLPDRVFRVSQHETALLVAKGEVRQPGNTMVSFAQVRDADRDRFLMDFSCSRRDIQQKSVPEFAVSARVPALAELWQLLKDSLTFGDVAKLHRGVEWQPPFDEEKYISSKAKRGFARGLYKVPSEYVAYQTPTTCYLLTSPEDRLRRAFDLPWDQPKLIANAARLAREGWRIAAFPDRDGLVCSQRFFGIWPRREYSINVLAAILNGPIANAFLAVHEDTRDNRKSTLCQIPSPLLTDAQFASLDGLVEEYRTIGHNDSATFVTPDELASRNEAQRNLLLQIDAQVLQGYRLPPRVERSLLDRFRGYQRRVPFTFTEYFPEEFTPAIPLSMYISDDFSRCNSGFLRERLPQVTDPVLIDALSEVE